MYHLGSIFFLYQVVAKQNLILAVFLYYCSDGPSCPAHLNSINWATLATRVAIKKYYSVPQTHDNVMWMYVFSISYIFGVFRLQVGQATSW